MRSRVDRTNTGIDEVPEVSQPVLRSGEDAPEFEAHGLPQAVAIARLELARIEAEIESLKRRRVLLRRGIQALSGERVTGGLPKEVAS